MEDVLYQYELNATTWVYLSGLLIIVIFFKFNRFWSVRNLDLIGLILLAPGLLMVAFGHGGGPNSASAAAKTATAQAGTETPPTETNTSPAETRAPQTSPEDASAAETRTGEAAAAKSSAMTVADWGYVWLFVVGVFFLVRLLIDPLMLRRPLLEPNLLPGGLLFLGTALFIFLMANVVTAKLPGAADQADLQASETRDGDTADAGEVARAGSAQGPGYYFIDRLPRIPSETFDTSTPQPQDPAHINVARVLVILSHLAVVLGLIVVGYRHFDNIWTGIAVATLYLLLPYTAQLVGRIHNVLPAALLIWSVATYRRPIMAGGLIGLAIGSCYFPLFLLPLWIGFYWQRGLLRFLGGAAFTVSVLAVALAFGSSDMGEFAAHLQRMFGIVSPKFSPTEGFWAVHPQYYRWPIFALYLVMCAGMAIWPTQKNLGTLISCSAAIMLGTQFWYAHGGLLHINWYMPLLLLTAFRPNLEHRVAKSSLGESWLQRRKELKPRAA